MPRSPPAQSQSRRAGLPSRSKGGCLTCKAKHIKCDETHPACQRCTQKGLTCGGYQQGVVIRWAAKHQLHLPFHHTRAPESGPVAAPTSDGVPRRPSSSPPSASTEPYSSSDSFPPTSSSPTPGLIDASSAFIVHWFEHVCPAWSAFDSDANPIRTIAVDVWRSSVTVCSTLEAMSAAFVASRDPHVRQPALRLMRRAADYAQMEHNGSLSLATLPTGLLFSLFGLGTTACWVDARSLGLPFLRETRRLLARLNHQSQRDHERDHAGAVDAELLEFFNKCMTYCNMLLSVVHDDVDVSTTPLPPTPATATPSTIITAERRPHPWTGISSLASWLFAETMGLCRRTQLVSESSEFSESISIAATPLPILCLRAQRLEEWLLDAEIEVPLNPGNSNSNSNSNSPRSLGDTGDSRTPPSHLALIAEAYRLSSLLVLYQTFPNLGFLRLPLPLPASADGPPSVPSVPSVLWQEWITPLSLHLLQVLKRIPPTSGSRVIQPLLYICASTGLRRQGSTDEAHEFGFGSEAESDKAESDKAHQGRSFILERLAILESSLPPTPVRVAKELVRAIWRSYDSTLPGTEPVHWIKVMEANNLRSMFG